MTLVIDLAPEEIDRLRREAERHGMEAADYAHQLIRQSLPAVDERAMAQLVQSWMDQDATSDPEEVRRAEAELAAFKRAMNENRAGEAPLYP
jgi:hypothetical protein